MLQAQLEHQDFGSQIRVIFQEFVAIVIMVASLHPGHVEKLSGGQFLEVFSGQARTARLAGWSGYRSKAVDRLYSKSMDLLQPSGFMLLSCSSGRQ
jgi:hypothetical protein